MKKATVIHKMWWLMRWDVCDIYGQKKKIKVGVGGHFASFFILFIYLIYFILCDGLYCGASMGHTPTANKQTGFGTQTILGLFL